jgi:two-component sensor histidine kinase
MRAEERQNLLINELNHRVKNTLASVQSMAVLTMRHTDSPAAFNRAFLSRLQALSITHNLLTETQWTGAAVGDLVKRELQPYAAQGERRVEARGEKVELKPSQVISLGLFLHELATNAAKYGALSTPAGRVQVSWQCRGDGRLLNLQWRECGGPPIVAPTRQGFGSRLIEQTIRDAMRGTLTVDYAPDGLRCEVAVPL